MPRLSPLRPVATSVASISNQMQASAPAGGGKARISAWRMAGRAGRAAPAILLRGSEGGQKPLDRARAGLGLRIVEGLVELLRVLPDR